MANLKKSDLVAVRPPLPGDVNFILATWLRGLRYGNEMFGYIDKEAYFKVYHTVIEAILKSPSTQVQVACLKEDPEVILGYAVFQGNKVHWVHVKSAWRQIGIAKSLIPSTFDTVTHLTAAAISILTRKCPSVKFNPFLTP